MALNGECFSSKLPSGTTSPTMVLVQLGVSQSYQLRKIRFAKSRASRTRKHVTRKRWGDSDLTLEQANSSRVAVLLHSDFTRATP